jgi:hypothetical protein
MNTIAPGSGQELGGQVDQARNVLIAIVAPVWMRRGAAEAAEAQGSLGTMIHMAI